MAIINCLNLNNILDISDNSKYLINNINADDNIIFGVFTTNSTKKYTIDNIPKNYPIGFYNNLSPSSSISNLIIYDVSYSEPIKIYVSNGNDLSYNNGDYYRFYDSSLNLINIKGISNDLLITTSGENFYFMRNMEYKFIATLDFSTNHPFCISGNLLATNGILYNNVRLNQYGDNFTIKIPSQANNINQNNKIFYCNYNKINDVSGTFNILTDADNISYFYNKISIEVPNTYALNHPTNLISFKSFVINNNSQIIHIDKLGYSESCGYVIAELSAFVSLLALQGIECLNKISKATLDTSTNGVKFYELNTNNHGLQISYNNRYDLTYGIYDGNYVIFNIDEDYPITLINNDVSNNIYIDEEYIRTNIIHKSDNRIKNLVSPYNLYNYYYGAIKLWIDNSNNGITNIPIKMRLYDLKLLLNYELSCNFLYTSFCTEPDNVNNIGNNTPVFKLYNKKNELFTQNNYNIGNNIFDLNLYELYVEPKQRYLVLDRYNHDISNLVTSNAPLTINAINYNLETFLITYNLLDYEDNITRRNRLVRINRGPFIEILNNNIFDGSNQYINLINLSPNLYTNDYNFIDDIDVYIYDKNRNKINLPYEIILSGFYYNSNSIFSNKISQTITGNRKNIINYNIINNSEPLHIHNSLNYYLSKNIELTYETTFLNIVNEVGIKIKNIKNIVLDNLNSAILNQFNIIYVNDRDTETFNNFLIFRSFTEEIDSIILDADTNQLKINNINNNLSQIILTQKYLNLSLNTTLTITNLHFKIKFIDLNNANNNLIIDGSFDSIDFFNNEYIDISYIGSYTLNIKPKGLLTTDYIYNDISNIINFNSLNTNYSRNIKINIIDNKNPELYFYNNYIRNTSYIYTYPRNLIFNVINNIIYYNNFNNSFIADNLKPLIQYNDNFLYNGYLQYDLLNNDNNTSLLNNNLNLINNTIDGSAVIIYYTKDLCGNISNSINLTLFFRDIPYVELIGEQVKSALIYLNYSDDGIIIDNNNNLIFKPLSSVGSPTSGNGEITISSNLKYDIFWETNINISSIGQYYFKYTINKQYYNGTSYVVIPYTAVIQRNIILNDNAKPTYRFPQLFTISKGYIDASNGLILDIDYQNIKNSLILHSENNSFNIDFSLTVFSHFSDLSSIINNFNVTDNYSSLTKANNVIINLFINDIEVPFTENDLKRVDYLTTNNLLKKVTIGNNSVKNLKFVYTADDNNNNKYIVERIVDIIDVAPPTLSFSFIPIHNDFSYAIFNNIDFKDISYQALDISKNEVLFYNELNSVLFGFALDDNYDISANAYNISIIDGTYIDNNIKNIYDLSNNSLKLFSQINKKFDIKYDFWDNQFNYSSKIRKIDIISTIAPDISFKNTEPLIINFGDINYNLKDNFNISHARFFNLDINIDLSYILPLPYTSFSGETLYDINAIINPILTTKIYETHDISFYSVLLQTGNNLISDILNIIVEIRNKGPIFKPINNIIESEAGIYISDASLIIGVIPISEYDKFYYYNFVSDISYTFTIFDISYDNYFNQDKPEIGIYNIEYIATDKNNYKNILSRTIKILDNLPPTITFENNFYSIIQLETLTIPEAIIIDIGSGLKSLIIDLSNNINNSIKRVLIEDNINKKYYDFSNSNLLLSEIDTSSSTINYTATYTVKDYQNNSIKKGIQIQILPTITYVLKMYMKIDNNYILLNNNFDVCFNELVINNENLPFVTNSIRYNVLDNRITYEATTLADFSYISFYMSAIYTGVAIADENNNIVNNIIPNVIGNYEIYFQSYNPDNFDSKTELIYFKVIDTTPPKLSFIENSFFLDICNIELPLLTPLTLEILNLNINNFVNINYDNFNIFNKVDNVVIYSIPGININDIVNGTTITLSNEDITPDFSNVFTIEISYNIMNTSSMIDNSSMLLNADTYIQNYRVYDDVDNQIDLSRNIEVKLYPPFIKLEYIRNANNHLYTKTYHQQYAVYKDLLGSIYDYYNDIITDNRIIIKNTIDESILGIQYVTLNLQYDISGENPYVERQVHVIHIDCMNKYINDFRDLITDNINYKNGIYDGSYNINVDISAYAFRIYGYNYDNNVILDISNLIRLSGDYVISYNNEEYYWGNTIIEVLGDFNRANIEYFNTENPIILEDTLIYNSVCNNILLEDIYDKIPLLDTYIVDISGTNQNRDDGIIKSQFFTMYNINAPLDISNRPILHLPIGRYRFIQSKYKNFYNKIKFSITNDGIHNNGIEYTKDVRTYRLAGLSNSYTDIIISATTPTPLYYYSENIPDMGNYIHIKNNILISDANMYISDNVLSAENRNVLVNSFGMDELINKVVICQKFNLLNLTNGDREDKVNFVCITHQNINHNIGFDAGKNKLLFKKYQHTIGFNPVISLGLSNPVPTCDLVNNIKQDITNNYLCDVSVNNSYTNLFFFKLLKDTSENIISNIETNLIENEYVVGVGESSNTIIYSNNKVKSWLELGNNVLSISALGVDYNGYRWIAVGNGNATIAYSDNGFEWFNLRNTNLIFSIEGNNVYWNKELSVWYILGRGTNTIAYSDNGIFWTGLGNIFTIAGYGIYYNDGLYVAVGEGVDSIKYSVDGLIWNNVLNSNNIFIRGRSVRWMEKLNIWVAVGTGNFTIATSLDGINWSGLSNSLSLFSIEGHDIDYDGINVVLVGEGINTIIYSFDLINWNTLGRTIFENRGLGISWSGSNWYAVGEGINTIAVSKNGYNWFRVNNSSNLLNIGRKIKGYNVVKKLYVDVEKIRYEINTNDIYYKNGEISRYYNYFKRNKLLDVFIYSSSYLNKINEILYENKVDIYNNNKLYEYLEGEFMNTNRIIFSNILENLITLNLQTYIDVSSIFIDDELRNYLIKNSNNIKNTNYLIDNNNLFFGEYVINILSDISGIFPDNFISPQQSIIFSNGVIELNEYLLDSNNSYNVIDVLYYNYISIYGIDNFNKDVEDKVFLSIRDNNFTNYKYIGLTQQNIFHNFLIDENQKFIFHKYDISINPVFVNKYTTLNKTLHDLSNNKKYLLEISSNDVYNCFVTDNNIYENVHLKNTSIPLGTTNYKSIISYFINNELNTNNSYIDRFNINPISLNNISYQNYPYTYDINLQYLHTHTYYIDLADYFNRIFYNNSKIIVPYNIIDTDYINYTIVDISYVNDFNIFDIDTSINILYNKSKIEILNYIQLYITSTNFKLNFFGNLIKYSIIYQNNISNYNVNNYTLINNVSLQNLHSLYEEFNFITNNYVVSLNNNSLNTLYSNNYFNTNKLVQKYNNIIQLFNFHQDIELINTGLNPYNDINNFTNIEQMEIDINLINYGLDTIMKTLNFYYDDTNIFEIYNHYENTYINSYNNFNSLIYLTERYFYIRNTLERIIYEFNVRDLNNGLISSQTLITYSFIDIYNVSDLNTYIDLLKENYVIMDQLLRQLITYSKIYVLTPYGQNIPDISFTIMSGDNIIFADLSNQAIHVINNFDAFLQYSKSNYDFIDKLILFDNVNYVLNGSKLLINSYKSNNIVIKLNLLYNTYLYPNITLDTIVLDITIPDKTPPTIIFSQNTTITLEQTFSTLTDNSINAIIEKLISDIEYIDIDQDFNNITLSDVNAIYNDYNIIFNNQSANLLENNVYSLITLDIKNIYNPTGLESDNIIPVDIYYIIKDNVNNINRVTRTINVIQSLNSPIFFFYNQSLDLFLKSIAPQRWSINIQQNSTITNDILLSNIKAIDPLTNLNVPVNVSWTLTNTNIPGTYFSVITYTATGSNGNTSYTNRDIIVTEIPDVPDVIVKASHCCYPPAYYLPVQHRYKLGADGASVMRLAKIILNNK